MKFFKKHKVLAFAVISFFVLSGVNFYMIFELVKVIRRDLAENQPFGSFFLAGLLPQKNGLFGYFTLKRHYVILGSSKNVKYCV